MENDDFCYCIDVLESLKEEIERKFNRKFILDLNYRKIITGDDSPQKGIYQRFNVMQNFFAQDTQDPEIYSKLTANFIYMNEKLMTLKVGRSRCSLLFKESAREKFYDLALAIQNKKMSLMYQHKHLYLDEALNSFGSIILSVVLSISLQK